MSTPWIESLETVDAALAAASPKLAPDEKRLAVAIYQLLASGNPVGIGAAAARAQVSPAWAEDTVASWPAVFFNDSRNVVGFWGLALADRAHRVHRGGVALYTWCAWDPLFLARIIGALEVSTNDLVSGEEITYRLGADGGITDVSHPDSVLSFLRPDRPWDDEVQTHFCHYIWHFTSCDTAETWTAQHPATFILDLDASAELARRHVERISSDHRGPG